MRNLLAIVLVCIAIQSCRKENVEVSTILTSHDWSPYQARIITIDTTTIITLDSSGEKHSVTSTFRKDTTYNFDPCIQQSTYSFLPSGVSHITDKCLTGESKTDEFWSIQPNKTLQIVLLEDPAAEVYFAKLYPGTWSTSIPPDIFYPLQNGSLTQISASEFVVDQRTGLNGGFSYYTNGKRVDSIVNIFSDRYVSFRSR